MTVLLLDASVWLAAINPGERYHDDARRLVAPGRDERDLGSLDLTIFEVTNVALTRWHSPEDARRVAELVEIASAANVERVDGETAAYTVDVAAELGLTAYAAAYVAVSRRRGWTLVSCDLEGLVGPGHAVPPDAVPAPAR